MSAINWFEIPTTDLERATKFYETVLEVRLKLQPFGDMRLAVFPSTPAETGGALVADSRRRPSAQGALVYLDAGGKLDACLGRVAGAGGKIVLPKTDIGAPGFIAIVEDSEGNVVGLHTQR